jgi:hypothetical protein
VNDSTVQLAPEVPIKELGNVLPQLLDFMVDIPAKEHIHFLKMDLADGRSARGPLELCMCDAITTRDSHLPCHP